MTDATSRPCGCERKRAAAAPNLRGVALPVGVILPANDPRKAAEIFMVGRNRAAEARMRQKIEAAQQRMADELRRAMIEGEAEATAADDPTNRPPRRDAGRYGGLKDGQQRDAS